MPKPSTFKVSRTGVEAVTVNFVEPENLQDPRWGELGISPEALNEMAVQALVIRIQSGARGKLDEGPAAVQKFVDEYKYGTRSGGGGTRKVTLAAEKVSSLKFTPEQLDALRAAGVVIPGMEESADSAKGATSAKKAA